MKYNETKTIVIEDHLPDGVEWGVMLNGNPTDFSDENYVKCNSEAQAFLISNTMNLAYNESRKAAGVVGYVVRSIVAILVMFIVIPLIGTLGVKYLMFLWDLFNL